MLGNREMNGDGPHQVIDKDRPNAYLADLRDRLMQDIERQQAFLFEAMGTLRDVRFLSDRFAKHIPEPARGAQRPSVRSLIQRYEALSGVEPRETQAQATLRKFRQLKHNPIMKEGMNACNAAAKLLRKVIALQATIRPNWPHGGDVDTWGQGQGQGDMGA